MREVTNMRERRADEPAPRDEPTDTAESTARKAISIAAQPGDTTTIQDLLDPHSTDPAS